MSKSMEAEFWLSVAIHNSAVDLQRKKPNKARLSRLNCFAMLSAMTLCPRGGAAIEPSKSISG
ncbi:hypothetical protein E7681_14135 [Thalassobius vesicularis]|uniref:Uncharacterized protein n=1 Tax=Thalassobius vesicularis TaxID=1294297 RepID=A0A4S3M692_9RHOB|nr:hypothetical protein [Thalassobius vesicularis]THD72566.1 hypothetical protein E7681_14135 [Thalassobius vesicularis]